MSRGHAKNAAFSCPKKCGRALLRALLALTRGPVRPQDRRGAEIGAAEDRGYGVSSKTGRNQGIRYPRRDASIRGTGLRARCPEVPQGREAGQAREGFDEREACHRAPWWASGGDAAASPLQYPAIEPSQQQGRCARGAGPTRSV